jgi:hypothetical protein
MKVLFSLFVFLSFFNNPDISEIRKSYANASNSEALSKELYSKLSDVTNESDKTLVAYKGASITLMSRFSKKIADKINRFKEGAKLVEFAVAKEPNNIEIRLIRLSIQANVPKIVKYNSNKKEDKDFILAHYKEQSGALKEYVKNFILQSKIFSAAEKQTIK